MKLRHLILLCAVLGMAAVGRGQATWVQQSPTNSPSPRGYGSMVFDELHQEIVLFGGTNLDGGGTFLGDTWAWNGSNWSQFSPAASPSPRSAYALVYDELHQQVVLFGGYSNANIALSDTWTWDGSNWTAKAPPASPSGRRFPSIAYDSSHHQVVLFGGIGAGSKCLADTWVWDGAAWTLQHPLHNPAPSYCNNVMTYDAASQQSVLIVAELGLTPDQTWTWDGSDWTLQAPAPQLEQKYGMTQIAYDSVEQKIVQFGGYSSFNSFLSDTWTWDGATWAALSTLANPSMREYVPLAYDPVRKQTVLFGGAGPGSTGTEVVFADTWTLASTGGPGVTITVPGGVQYVFNSQTYTGTQTISVAPGTYTLSTTSPQQTAAGTKAVFQSWSDGGAIGHSVSVGSANVPITGNFKLQYLLTTSANPPNRGVVTQTGPGAAGPYYDAGTLVTVTEAVSSGYTFSGWSGACSGTNPFCFVTMNSPLTVSGTFQQQTFGLTIAVPAGVQYTISGFPLTGTQTLPLPAGTYSLGLVSPQAMGAGTRSVFVAWSDGGAQSHNVVLGSAALTVTGTFKTQYLLSLVSLPSNGGSVSPGAPGPSAPYYDAGSTLVLSESPNAGFDFEYWGGACAGSNPFCLVFMTAPMNVNANFAASLKWFPLFPGAIPAPRAYGAAAYDSLRQQTVAFGGIDNNSNLLNETWVWDGVTWTQRFPAHVPPARWAEGMAFDSHNNQVVMFGGYAPSAATDVIGRGILADTWTWNGTDWTHLSPSAAHPPARGFPGMAYDAVHQQTVLFGGSGPGAFLADTWTWSGTAWTQKSLGLAPPPRLGCGMAFDAARAQIVVFGGTSSFTVTNALLSDTWVWNGTAWAQKLPVSNPPARTTPAMAYDGLAQQTVLFSGANESFPNVTWLWDGANWLQKSYPVSPIERDGAFAAYDSARQQLVLSAGSNPSGDFLNDTWIYANNVNPAQFVLSASVTPAGSGSVSAYAPGQPGPSYYAGTKVQVTALPGSGFDLQSWSGACAGISQCVVTMNSNQSVTANFGPPIQWVERFPAVSPQPTPKAGTETMSLAFDEARQQVVFFGEPFGGQQYGNQTWVWNGTTWTQKFPVNSPSPRYGHGTAYDEIHQQVVLFGGVTAAGTVSDTWVWDGADWTQKAIGATAPGRRINQGMAFDGHQIVLFGGWSADSSFIIYSDTWVWDGTAWTQKVLATHPGARSDFGMTYDAAHHQVVAFSGFDAGANDTWLWNGAAWSQALPVSSPPQGWNVMAYDSLRQQSIMVLEDPAGIQTWIWDGIGWIRKNTIISPPSRMATAMTYDPVRQQAVLFGGDPISGTGLLGDTWVLGNSVAASQFLLSTSASPATGGSVAQSSAGQAAPNYLPGSQVLVTAAANPGYEFESWSGACSGFSPCTVTMTGNLAVTANFGIPMKWVQLNPASSPQALPATFTENVPLVYDAARQQIVLFGGPYGGQQFGNQTWVWDGNTWTQKFPATNPPGRYGHSLAYDVINGQVVLFGGLNTLGALSDTWVWDGTNWTQKAAGVPGPVARLNHRMASDGQHVLLFGGWTGNFTGTYLLNDTWIWDGAKWTQQTPVTFPSGRSDFGLAYDAARKQVVLFSGFEVGNDTWVWDGTTWILKTPAVAPPQGWTVMAHDGARQQVVLFDQSLTPPQTWVWDGTSWVQRVTVVSPTRRFAAGLAYDDATQQTVLFGGTDLASDSAVADTWVWLPPAANVIPEGASIVKDSGGNLLVTVSVKNGGNIPLSNIQVSSGKLGATSSTMFTAPASIANVGIGATVSFTAKFPPSAGIGTSAPVLFTGTYSAGGTAGAAWTVNVRVVTLP